MNGPPNTQTVPPHIVTRVVGATFDVWHDAPGNVTVEIRDDGSIWLPAGPKWLVYAVESPCQPGSLFVGDYPPALIQVAAGVLTSHADLDVQEIGRRLAAAATTTEGDPRP